ncbi:MAG: hypothetical protein ACOCQA_02915, partial [bacterium]
KKLIISIGLEAVILLAVYSFLFHSSSRLKLLSSIIYFKEPFLWGPRGLLLHQVPADKPAAQS